MPSLTDLPLEILYLIQPHLDPPSVFNVAQVCTRLHTVFDETFFQKACQRYGFLQAGQTLEDLRRPLLSSVEPGNVIGDGQTWPRWKIAGAKTLHDLASYRHLFLGSWLLERAREQSDLSLVGGLQSLKHEMWYDRMFFDHIDSVVISVASPNTPLMVSCMHSGRILFSIPRIVGDDAWTTTDVYYSQGWLIVADWPVPNHDGFLSHRVFSFERCDTSNPSPRRGFLSEMEPLDQQLGLMNLLCAFDFPYLLVAAGPSGEEVGIFHIITREFVKIIRIENPRVNLIHHGGFDDDFVWIIGCSNAETYSLHTYCRRTGNFLWRLSPEQPVVAHAQVYGYSEEYRSTGHSGRRSVCIKAVDDCQARRLHHEVFRFVHPDPHTGSLCLTTDKTKVIVPDYKTFHPAAFDPDDPSSKSPVLIIDNQHEAQRREMQPEPSSLEAIAEGQVAFVTETGIALLNLAKLLVLHARRITSGSTCEGDEDGVAGIMCILSPPELGSENFQETFNVVLSSTHLGWICPSVKIAIKETDGTVPMHSPNSCVYTAEKQEGSIYWIDFARLRAGIEDQEARSLFYLKDTLKAEHKRRLVKAGEIPSDPTTEVIDDWLVEGRFGDIADWIDWERFHAVDPDRAAAFARGEPGTASTA